MSNPVNPFITLVVGILSGGLGGAVFTWIANRRLRLSPAFQLRLLRSEGGRCTIRYDDESVERARYYRTRVSNSRRFSPATDTQIFLTRGEEPAADGNFQVVWVTDVPLRWRNQESSPLIRTIGQDADCDLCLVSERRRFG